MDAAGFPPGTLLAGKYEVVRLLGSGGMGEVYEATHQALGKRVAVKLLRADAASHPEFRQRFEREARAAASLRGPHAAQVSDVDVLTDGRPFLVMEYLEGRDLNDEMEARGPLPAPEAVDYILQTCSAMAEAHGRGIVHRDLKPHNLYLTDSGGETVVKVLDFGISKVDEGDASVTATSVAMGTPLYMAPEQMRSAKHVDARADIWSLGVILYELLAGKPPFDGDNPTAVIAAVTADDPTDLAQVRPDLPVALTRVVMAALRKDKERRPGSVLELGALLAPFSPAGTWEPKAPRESLVSLHRRQPPLSPASVAPTAAMTSVGPLSLSNRHDTHASWSTQGRHRARRRRATKVVLGASVGLTLLATVGAFTYVRSDGAVPDLASSSPTTSSPAVSARSNRHGDDGTGASSPLPEDGAAAADLPSSSEASSEGSPSDSGRPRAGMASPSPRPPSPRPDPATSPRVAPTASARTAPPAASPPPPRKPPSTDNPVLL
ncbi:MAG: serine/threonine-protein kinase [Myxococcota bacterium]